MVLKTNTYASVHNPLTKTVDNEKTLSFKVDWQKNRSQELDHYIFTVNLTSGVDSAVRGTLFSNFGNLNNYVF